MLRILGNTNFDFVGKRKIAYTVSLCIILLGLISVVFHKGFVYGVDFSGGLLLELHFKTPVPIQDVRSAISSAGFKAEIQQIADKPTDMIIRVKQTETGEIVGAKVREVLKTKFASAVPENEVEWVLRQETVGPKIGEELKGKALGAIIVSLIGILIYVGFRFGDVKFGVGAVVALIHDTLITLGFISFFNYEIDLTIIAALLTMIGFSINDTIVVCDRIRENMRIARKQTLEEIINISINQTLSRTILTSLTVFITCFMLFIIGGEVIHGFAFTMLVGVITGTYSSVFVAVPVVIEWKKLTEGGKRVPVGSK